MTITATCTNDRSTTCDTECQTSSHLFDFEKIYSDAECDSNDERLYMEDGGNPPTLGACKDRVIQYLRQNNKTIVGRHYDYGKTNNQCWIEKTWMTQNNKCIKKSSANYHVYEIKASNRCWVDIKSNAAKKACAANGGQIRGAWNRGTLSTGTTDWLFKTVTHTGPASLENTDCPPTHLYRSTQYPEYCFHLERCAQQYTTTCGTNPYVYSPKTPSWINVPCRDAAPCTVPGDLANMEVQGTPTLTQNGFDARLACKDGYTGAPTATVCATPGTPFATSGSCTPKPCTVPDDLDAKHMEVQGTPTLTKSGFDATLACKDGYGLFKYGDRDTTNSIPARKCTSPGGDIRVPGKYTCKQRIGPSWCVPGTTNTFFRIGCKRGTMKSSPKGCNDNETLVECFSPEEQDRSPPSTPIALKNCCGDQTDAAFQKCCNEGYSTGGQGCGPKRNGRWTNTCIMAEPGPSPKLKRS